MSETQSTRREVIRRALYVTPVILTLPVLPSFTSAGSGDPKDKTEKDKKPK
jgi:hypothetical protein